MHGCWALTTDRNLNVEKYAQMANVSFAAFSSHYVEQP
jgi:hypothetical protein